MKNTKYLILILVAWLGFNYLGDYLLAISNHSLIVDIILAVIQYGFIIYVIYRALKANKVSKAGNEIPQKAGDDPFFMSLIVIFILMIVLPALAVYMAFGGGR